MELRMMELVSGRPVVMSHGGSRKAFGATGIDGLAVKPVAPWQVGLGAAMARAECGNTSFGGVRWPEEARTGGISWRRWEGRRRNASKVGDARTSTSEEAVPEVSVSERSEGAAAVAKGERGQQRRRRRRRGGDSSSEDETEEPTEGGYKMSQICDRLIEVFSTEKTTPVEWRALLALSVEWTRIRPYFYKHCQAKARAETVAKKKRQLIKLASEVKEVDDKMTLHNGMLAEIEKDPLDIDIIVAKRRNEFTGDFFEHLQTVYNANSKSKRRDAIASIAGKCLSLVEAYDAAIDDTEAITEAQLKFDSILGASSLEAAANKIDQLARSKELDSTLLLLITKAWAVAKDSATMNQEAKDAMFYMYKAAKRSMLRLIPDEIPILKRLLSIPDPRDRFAALTDAFSPGDELERRDEDKLHTTPEKLKHWMKKILDAYHSNMQSSVVPEARNLMTPEVITRLEMLLEYMDSSFIL